eukprot:1352425-Pyramimonas_sp.AAC.1
MPMGSCGCASNCLVVARLAMFMKNWPSVSEFLVTAWDPIGSEASRSQLALCSQLSDGRTNSFELLFFAQLTGTECRT